MIRLIPAKEELYLIDLVMPKMGHKVEPTPSAQAPLGACVDHCHPMELPMNAPDPAVALQALDDLTRLTREPLPASRKVYVEGSHPGVRVPMREISQTDTPAAFGAEAPSGATALVRPAIVLHSREELDLGVGGAPGRIRTPNRPGRNRVLYPIELRRPTIAGPTALHVATGFGTGPGLTYAVGSLGGCSSVRLEHRVVVADVAGSNPVSHPTKLQLFTTRL